MNFKHILQLFLMFLLSTLSMFLLAGMSSWDTKFIKHSDFTKLTVRKYLEN